MTNSNIVRSWKDDDYLLNLSSQERAYLPDNPAGLTELTDEEMFNVNGGTTLVSIVVATVFYSAASVGAIASAVMTILTHR